jgi:hypothetical protein
MKKIIRPELVPSVADYVKAFQEIEPKLTKNQRRMLINHSTAPCYVTTARDQALSVGYKDYGAANIQYGRLGSKIADAMGIKFRGVLMLVIMAHPGTATNTEWLWVMRANVVQALEELGWVEKKSHLFHPWGPLEVEPNTEN